MILLASCYSHNYAGILASPLEIYCQCSIKVVHDKSVKQASKDLLQHNITGFHWLSQLQQAACLWTLSNKSILPHWWGFHSRQPYSINGHIMLLYVEDLALHGALHMVCHKRIQTSSCFSSLQGVQGQQPCVLEISEVAYFFLNQYYTMHTCTCPFSILL